MVDFDTAESLKGNIGERLIAELLQQDFPNGSAVLSENKFDHKKDMTWTDHTGSYTIEVKCKSIDCNRRMFTADSHQLTKCLSVDLLFFICTECTNPIYNVPGFTDWIFVAMPTRTPFEYTLFAPKKNKPQSKSSKGERFGVSIDGPWFKKWKKIPDDWVPLLYEHTKTNY